MYIVMTASAKMPSSCRGRYGRVAVVEVADGAAAPKIIANTKGARIIRTWERLSIGKTTRSAFAVGLAEAEALAAKLNATVGEDFVR